MCSFWIAASSRTRSSEKFHASARARACEYFTRFPTLPSASWLIAGSGEWSAAFARVLSTTERPSRSLEAHFYIPPNDGTEPEEVEGRDRGPRARARIAGGSTLRGNLRPFSGSQVKRTLVGTRERQRQAAEEDYLV